MPDAEKSKASQTIDPSDPLYLHPGDGTGQKLVSTVFDGNSFGSWKRSMLIALSAKNKIGFVNGDIPKPRLSDPKYGLWRRCNDMVISWITSSVDKEISDYFIYTETAKEIWDELVERFEQFNGSQIYQVQSQLQATTQGSDSVSLYFIKLKKLWEELRSIWSMPECTCGASKSMIKHEQEQRVIKFLMGLNDIYNTVRANILMMSPLPSLNVVFSLLIQEEKQREITTQSPLNLDASAMAARNWQHKSNHNKNPGQYHGNYAQNFRSGNRNAQSHGDRRKLYYCTRCKMEGHSNSRSIILHPELRRNWIPPVTTNVHSNPRPSTQNTDSAGTSGAANMAEFSYNQEHDQIMKELSKFESIDPGETHAMMAGPFHQHILDPW